MPTVSDESTPRSTGSSPERLSAARLVADIPRLLRSPCETFALWQRRHGDVVRVPLTLPPMFLLSSPPDIRHVLVSHRANYRKTGGERAASRLLGRGLIRSRGRLYRQQRAIIAPSFHRRQIEAATDSMVRETAAVLDEWIPGPIDIGREMGGCTLRILGAALFDADLGSEVPRVIDNMLTALRYMHPTAIFVFPRWLPSPKRRAYERAVNEIHSVAAELIDERRRRPHDGDDLLSTLVRARDPDGAPLSDRQIRDEVVNLILAGHETTATGLAWFWHEVLARPGLFERLRAEVDEVLGRSGVPDAAAVGRMELVEASFREAIRLHPPLWSIGRRAIDADVLPSGTRVPARSTIAISPYVVHRHPGLFDDPLEFRPERFLRATRPPIVAGSYIPFGAGPRSCIGEGFAMLEASIIIAMVIRNWDLEPLDDPPVTPADLLVRRPHAGVWVRLRRRG